ncbi:MAG: hypothetical protein C0624_04755 [Desulfuromonas sp.]|nr:MAG: hypothetical protein C0624_04755 [Desulfuromonas sp.]
MKISDRYRSIISDVRFLHEKLAGELSEGGERICRELQKAFEVLEELEDVGEIPQMRLEYKLSPLLLKAHGHLDRARVDVEKIDSKHAERIWEVEQTIYRLLNSL